MLDYLSGLFTPTILLYLLRGFAITLRVAVIAILLSIVFGAILGLIRSYAPKPLRMLAGAYVEWFRNTPNLLWVMVCFIAAPLPSDWARCTMAYVLFTSAMMAEIIRGGLNAIPKGQFEAAHSQGFTMVGTLWYIILPQCFRRIVPTMLSQIITVVKDTSFMAQVAVAELLFRTKNLMSIFYNVVGRQITAPDVFLLFGFAMLLYFAVNFTLSCIVRYLQKRNNSGVQAR
ncbi:MAG TPA: amino acid ABC transporter permease [Candidatus Enterenecus stercoripullorum]|nr:amino acid ABC transporter permease [Candidatus Enterenecus stercoripullorum]